MSGDHKKPNPEWVFCLFLFRLIKGLGRWMRDFILNHDKLVTTFGALLVFLGFVIKEGFRESAKDFSSELTFAGAQHDLDNAISGVTIRIAVIWNHQMSAEDTGAIAKSLDWNELNRTYAYIIENHLAETANLLAHLPHGRPQLLKKADELQKRLDQANKTCDSIKNQAGGKNVTNDPQLSESIQMQVKKLSDDLGKLNGEVAVLDTQVLTDAVSQSHVQEHHLHTATLFEYAVFVIGWALTLAGKLLKIPQLAGSAED